MRKFEYVSKVYHADAALTALGAEGWKVAGILAPGKGHTPPIILFERRIPKTKSDVVHDVAAELDVPIVDMPLSDYVTDEMDYAQRVMDTPPGAPLPVENQRFALNAALRDAFRIDWARQCANRKPSTAAQRWAHEVICLLGRQPTES